MYACCRLIYPSFAGWKSVAATLLNSNMLHPLDRLSVHHPLTHKVHFLSLTALQQRVWYMTRAHLPPYWGWRVLFSFRKINGRYTHGCHQNNKKKKKKKKKAPNSKHSRTARIQHQKRFLLSSQNRTEKKAHSDHTNRTRPAITTPYDWTSEDRGGFIKFNFSKAAKHNLNQRTNTANSSNNIPKNPAPFSDDSIESEQQTPKET